jgi:NAD(P)-dependent dehydrogenase (short-subunit alcohol dehydrogenase family)
MKILITGCSRGIGHEFIVQYLADPKVEKIFAVTRNADSLKPLVGKFPGRIELVPVSVSDDGAGGALREVLADQSLDLLINNAGTYPEEADAFEKIAIDSLREGMEVNVYAPFRVTQACLPALRRAKNAKVISITSLMGSIADNAGGGSYAYRMSKAALNMFNKSFSNDHRELIAVVLHPGWVQTDMGGTNAPTTKTESVSGMRKVIAGLTTQQSGRFYDFEGEELPW